MNQIICLEVKGVKVNNMEEIKEGPYEHFINWLRCVDKEKVFILGNLALSRLSENESQRLVEKFTIEEVKFSLQNTESKKAPGADGSVEKDVVNYQT